MRGLEGELRREDISASRLVSVRKNEHRQAGIHRGDQAEFLWQSRPSEIRADDAQCALALCDALPFAIVLARRVGNSR